VSQPSILLALAILFFVGASAAQPAPARTLRQRGVTVAGSGAPAPQVRLAPDTHTLLLFDADIDKDSVVLDATRVRVVDAGARSLVLQLLVKLGDRERLWLRVRFRDGAAPEEAVLALVSHPSEADALVDVTRHAQPLATCQAELEESQARCNAGTLADLAASGVLDDRGIFTDKLTVRTTHKLGPAPTGGWIHAGPGWFVLAVRLRHPPSERPWAFQEAGLTPTRGEGRFTARIVRVKRTAPETESLVVVEVASSEAPAASEYTLSLTEVPGAQPLMTLTVEIPPIPPSARSGPPEPTR
jgi:uncharacterized protein (TIGR02268 family)